MPRRRNPQMIFVSPRQFMLDLLLIATDSVISAIAINGILVPHRFVAGGITGLALIIHPSVPAMKVEWIYIVLDIYFFAAAWMAVGKRFFFFRLKNLIRKIDSEAFVVISNTLEVMNYRIGNQPHW